MIKTEQLIFGIDNFQLGALDLRIEKGKYFVLLGPPGSGKTIFLECLCGLKRPQSGRIIIDGRDVTHLEPRKRGIGYVPQDYALFVHLSVSQNIAFGLEVHKAGKKQITAKVNETAELLGIEHLLDRSITGLSGGEKQRTALARALVLEPKVLLLDEPVCALDEFTRQKVCGLLGKVQRQLGLTTIHVSHNLEEAFSVADNAAILNEGLLQQIGTLGDLLRKPNTEFVARFMRCENIFEGNCDGAAASGAMNISFDGLAVATSEICAMGKVKFAVRPEDILVFASDSDLPRQCNEFSAKLADWRDFGDHVKLKLEIAAYTTDDHTDPSQTQKLSAHLTHAAFAQLKAQTGDKLRAVIPPENIHLLQ
jgi:ABC-type Fe3+/spermidine/putrescine transport system ATPase subunit